MVKAFEAEDVERCAVILLCTSFGWRRGKGFAEVRFSSQSVREIRKMGKADEITALIGVHQITRLLREIGEIPRLTQLVQRLKALNPRKTDPKLVADMRTQSAGYRAL